MEEQRENRQLMKLTAKTFSGLENLLANELKEIGATEIEIINRGVKFSGDMEVMLKANYLCRTAIRVLMPIKVFNIKVQDDLYNEVMMINWPDIFKIDQTFIVDANVFYSEVTHSQYAALRVKDAIVDQFRQKTGKRPWVGKEEAEIHIDVHISHNVCTVSLNSSGESLHKRGYRIETDKAPINEVLAAGIILLSGWKGEKDFYDPMCGSGTIAIEAAMIANNIPSGYYRNKFAFMNWARYDQNLWEQVRLEANAKMFESDFRIFASDRSDKAAGIAKRNIKNAGLHKDIEVSVRYFDSIMPENNKGILVFNPPYGKRLEEKGDITDLYKSIGDTLKTNFTGFEAWIITPDFDFVKLIGLRPSEKITLYNGPVETKLLRFEMYEGSKKGKYMDDEQKESYRKERGRTESKDKPYLKSTEKPSYQKRDDSSEKRWFLNADEKKFGDRKKSFKYDNNGFRDGRKLGTRPGFNENRNNRDK